MRGALGAHISWANTEDRSARTSHGREAFEAKFLVEADGDPQRAESLRKAYFTRLALKSARSRRRAKEARQQAVSFEQEAAEAADELSAAMWPFGGGGAA